MDKKLIKSTAKTLLSLSLLSSYAMQYGFDFSAGLVKKTLNSAEDMSDYFLNSKMPKLEIGDYFFDKAVSVTDLSFKKAIQFQKFLKDKIR